MTSRTTHLLLIRHGETASNRERRLQGHRDIDLNAHGRAQAACLGRALSDERIDAVYASDLQRTRNTAQGLIGTRKLPLRLDAALRERAFGVFEGLLYDEVAAQYPEGYARWRAHDPSYGPPGGETLEIFHARVVTAVKRLAGQHLGQRIAIVTHGGVLDCLYRAASGMPMSGPRTQLLLNAAINRLEFQDDRLRVLGWGDVAHLEGLALDEVDRR